MNKRKLVLWTNLFLIMSFTIQAVTGIFLVLRLFISNPRLFRMIAELHEYNGIVMIVLVVFHLAENWGWIKANLLKTRLR